MLQNLANFFADNYLATILAAVVSYLFGSINFAIIVTRLYIRQDIRGLGSGNAGMTNVMRSVGVVPGIITLVGDIAKAAGAVLASRAIYRALGGADMLIKMSGMNSPILIASYLSGLFCLIGHLWPIYFRFRGGKGVAVTAGMLAVVDWRILLILVGIFLLMFIMTRIISVSTLTAVALFPLVTYLMYHFHPFREQGMGDTYVLICTVLSACYAVIVFIMHRENIKRIIKGEEKRLKLKK
ncbi:MAG: glycerol-3-phosphate 1-O-acyltransferase PlsY [Clostridia bacterium]|nr:glycerol-3-phosphate 1-O-acyltransferase PlsY [Clostridia bacterium]